MWSVERGIFVTYTHTRTVCAVMRIVTSLATHVWACTDLETETDSFVAPRDVFIGARWFSFQTSAWKTVLAEWRRIARNIPLFSCCSRSAGPTPATGWRRGLIDAFYSVSVAVALAIFIIAIIIKRTSTANTAEDAAADDDVTIMTSRRRRRRCRITGQCVRAASRQCSATLITRRRIWITRSAATSISRRNMSDYVVMLSWQRRRRVLCGETADRWVYLIIISMFIKQKGLTTTHCLYSGPTRIRIVYRLFNCVYFILRVYFNVSFFNVLYWCATLMS